MIYTNSGIIATGAPYSPVRFYNEAKNALLNGLVLLDRTNEGRDLIQQARKHYGVKQLTNQQLAGYLRSIPVPL